MWASKELLVNVIRHELAHYAVFIKHGHKSQAHSSEFRGFCQRMGWGEEVYRATISVEEHNSLSEEKNSIFRKIQKLMALSGSSNSNEAEQAMIKSQQLLLKHNIETIEIADADEEKMFLLRVIKQRRMDAKMTSIGKILETFFVNTVYNRQDDFTYLEILGTATNVEIAEYVAGVLEHEFDKLWEQTKRQHSQLKGMIAKNSFFKGLAKGYCEKVKALERGYHSELSNALMVIEKKLIDAKNMAYPRLVSNKSYSRHCSNSSALGEQIGRHLNINPAVKSSKSSEVFLTYNGGGCGIV